MIRRTSANDILLYELCPQKWAFVKNRKKELKQLYAFYRFSSALHHAAKIFTQGDDMIEAFEQYWGRYRDNYPLVYKAGETWQSLSDLGHVLLEQFAGQFRARDLEPVLMEQKIEVNGDDWIYTIQPDLIAHTTRIEYVTCEYKTTEERIHPTWVKASDQLSGQALAVSTELEQKPPVKVLICNFIKNGTIEWVTGERTAYQLDDYKRKIDYFVRLMNGKYHPRRSLYAFSSPCVWCDFGKECHGGGMTPEAFSMT